MQKKPPSPKLILKGFSKEKLAKKLGISREAIYKWKAISLDYIVQISEFTGIPLHELRPDRYKK